MTIKRKDITLAPANAYRWPVVTEKMVQSVVGYMKRGTLGEYEEESGPLLELERKFASYIGTKKALLCSSGTTALFSAYFAADIRPGDEVLVPAFTFVATASPLLFLGAKLVFVECERENGNMDPADLARKISKRTKAVVVTHNGGVPVDMAPVMRLKEKLGFFLIEDCARALGSEYRNRRVGSFGDISCFSFQEQKIVFGGEGGIAVTGNIALYERMALLGHYFRSRSETHVNLPGNRIFATTGLGLNFSIHPLSAIIANESFKSLEARISARYESIEAFKAELSRRKVRAIIPARTPRFCSKISYYHCVTTYNTSIFPEISREVFVSELKKRGVDARISDNRPLYRFPLFQKAANGVFGRLSGHSGRTPKKTTPADRFFLSIITFPPITDSGILVKYAQVISELESEFFQK